MRQKNNTILLIFCAILTFTLASCSEYFNAINGSVVTSDQIKDLEDKNPDKLISIVEPLILGVYASLNYAEAHDNFGLTSFFIRNDLGGQHMAMHTQNWFYFDYQLEYWYARYTRAYEHWAFFYSIIADCNSIINKISFTTTNPELKAILGQAFALRGFCLFNIAQQYQQTYNIAQNQPMGPIIITSEEGESKLYRASVSDVYAQIDKDFLFSLELLEGWERNNKIKINKNVASLLYARVCLVKNDWDNAIKYAVQARGNQSTLTIVEMREEKFNDINSREWMWGADITAENNTAYASFFSHMCAYDDGYGGEVGCYKKIDKRLFESIGTSDVRRDWFKVPGKSYSGQESAFPVYTNLKFKKAANWLGDYVFARVAETYLIEAEGYVQKNNLTEGANKLRALMVHRDPTWNKTVITLDDIFTQRGIELWGEGFSLYDHSRMARDIIRAYDGTNHFSSAAFNIRWGSWYYLYQIPQTEINNNSEISDADQNPAPNSSEKTYK